MGNGNDHGGGGGWRGYALTIVGAVMMLLLGGIFGQHMASSAIEGRFREHDARLAHPVSLEAQMAHQRESDLRFERIEQRLERIETKLDLLIERAGGGGRDGGGG